jgi:hypothetical protein
MKGDALPREDHVVRYVGGRFIDQVGETVTVFGNAFLSSPKDKNSPSFNWLECFGNDRIASIDEVRNITRLTYGSTARLAVVNVKSAVDAAASILPNAGIEIIHDPLESTEHFPEDPSHSLMLNIPEADEPHSDALADALEVCVIESFPARS